MSFGAYKYRDVIAMQDVGYLTAFQTSSSSGVFMTGGWSAGASTQSTGAVVSTFQTIGGSNNFHRLVYRLYVPIWTNWSAQASSWQHGSTSLFLCSLASSIASLSNLATWSAYSSLWSVGSNWGIIDSANCYAALYSSAFGPLVSSTAVLTLDVRPEKFSANYGPYITPLVTMTSHSAAVSNLLAMTCDAYLTDFEPASLFDQSTADYGALTVYETDYL